MNEYPQAWWLLPVTVRDIRNPFVYVKHDEPCFNESIIQGVKIGKCPT